MTSSDYNLLTYGANGQAERRKRLAGMLRNNPIPDEELLLNTGLFLVPQTLSRILFMDFLYKQILDVQGVVFDFGARWGQNSSLLTSLRGIYEPFNRLRKVVAFDTFEGFVEVTGEDGKSGMMSESSYSVTEGYENFLGELITLQEQESPLEHIKKHEIIKGDATVEVPKYLERNPETIVSFAYFDFDLYKPTKEVLLSIKDRLTKGSVIGFDEINDHDTPGETVALMEVFGLNNFAVKRYRYNSRTSYLIFE